MIDVSIIIVNFNSSLMCLDAVHSIVEKCKGENYEIIVVDNNSLNSEKEALAGLPNRCSVLFSQDNLGFGRANNLAAAKATGSNLLFLNPDTIVLNDVVALFLESQRNLDSENAIGIMGCYQRNRDLSFNHSWGSFENHLLSAFLKNELRQNIIKQLITPFKKFKKKDGIRACNIDSEIKKVDWINGACLFIRKKVFEAVGGFDGDFFLFSEEVDLQKRLSESGYSHILVPGPSIIHLHEDKRKMSGRTRIYFYDGYFTYAKKHFTALEFFLGKVSFILITACSLLIDIATKRYSLKENFALLKSLIIPRIKHA